jgi:hypothetical protein
MRFRWLKWLALAMSVAACGGDTEEPDTTPPAVASVEPADGATNVDPTSKIVLSFDEAIDRNTLDSDLLHLELEGQARYGNVAYDLDTFKATLSLSGPMQGGASYQGVLESGVRDLAGNRLAQPYRWTFTVKP